LAYEVIWTRMFIPIFGIGLYSVSAIVSSFMGGLALGGYICGRIIDKKHDLLRYYAVFELLIGVYAVILPFLIKLNQVTMPYFYNHVSSNFYIFSVFRCAIAFLLLIIPCSLIGATLPVMSRIIVFISKKEVSRGFSFLYAWNVLGSVFGCAAAAFLLLGSLGVLKTTYIFAGANMIIGLAALIYSRRMRGDRVSFSASGDIPVTKSVSPKGFSSKAALPAAFLCGFGFLSFELLWVRALVSLVPSDVYLFPVLLMVILGGNSLGSFLAYTWIARFRNYPLISGVLMVSGGIIVAASLRYIPFFPGCADWYVWFVCVAMVFPASAVTGMVFPCLVAWYSSGRENIGRDVGAVYSVNTVGAMLGSFLTAFVFIPFWGLRNTLFYVLLGYVLSGILIFTLGNGRIRRRREFALIFCALLSLVFLINDLVPAGLFRNIFIKHVGRKDEALIFYKEGLVSSIGLFKTKLCDHYSIRWSDRSDVMGERSSAGLNRRNHRLKAHIPLILHKDPRSVFNIGLGTGITAYSLTLHDNIRRIDNVEIMAETRELTPFFVRDSARIFQDPRSRVIVDDGRSLLFLTREKYDVIMAYPPPPLLDDIIYFYTKDFFELCKSKLNKGGWVSIWFPTKFLGPEASRTIAKTFLDVFPYAACWGTPGGPVIKDPSRGGVLIGTADKEAYDVSPEYLDKRMSSLSAAVRAELAEANICNAADLLGQCVADTSGVAELAKPAREIITDDHSYLDYLTAPQRWLVKEGDGLTRRYSRY